MQSTDMIFEAKRADRRYLRHVFAGLRPVGMPSFARQNDNASQRICLHLVTVECLAESDVKDARHDGVDSIFGMFAPHGNVERPRINRCAAMSAAKPNSWARRRRFRSRSIGRSRSAW